MGRNTKFIADEVSKLVEPILAGIGFELVEVEYLMHYGRWVLRVYVDKEGGVTIDDCASVSSELGDLIDVKEFIQHPYILEVSSPGLDRPLKKEKDFIQAIGKKVKIRMANPQMGRRNFSGYLYDFREEVLYLRVDNREVLLPWRDVEKANLVYEFGH